jgi:hypothetical protein
MSWGVAISPGASSRSARRRHGAVHDRRAIHVDFCIVDCRAPTSRTATAVRAAGVVMWVGVVAQSVACWTWGNMKRRASASISALKGNLSRSALARAAAGRAVMVSKWRWTFG